MVVVRHASVMVVLIIVVVFVLERIVSNILPKGYSLENEYHQCEVCR